MVCIHLRALEQALTDEGIRETYRGQVWSKNCREWVYFDVVLDIDGVRSIFSFEPCVKVHENADPKSGLERGFECQTCFDAVMGRMDGARQFPEPPIEQIPAPSV